MTTQPPIYLDYNATTPIAPAVLDAMIPYLTDHFGNPSSNHAYGRHAHQAVEKARGQVASLINCDPDEVIFTSGGTESNNTAIKGIAAAYAEQGKHIITTAIEHPAILEPCDYLRKQGYEITTLPVDGLGRVNPDEVRASIRPDTILISVMLANNEVGTIQPIKEIAATAHEHGIIIHTDAAQAIGKIPVDIADLGVDLLTIAGHKFYAPKGVGVLYQRKGTKLAQFMHGASHESNRRAGTENVPYLVGLGEAAQISKDNIAFHQLHMQTLRDKLQRLLIESISNVQVNGDTAHRLPNTLSISFYAIEANILLDSIAAQVAASAGAACHADHVTVSAVLRAMAIPIEYAKGTLRLSLGRTTTPNDVTRAATVIAKAVENWRRLSNIGSE